MKKLLLFAILLGGCAALRTPQTPVEAPAPVEVSQPEAPKPVTVEPIKPTQPVVIPVEVGHVEPSRATRFVLDYPQTYAKYIPRVEKFFQLALTDSSVLNKSKWDFSDATPEQIRERIRGGFDVRITTYKPSIWKGGKWSHVIGYHSAGTIYLNTYYIVRPDCEIINTLVHEPMHTLGYSHGNNLPDGKDDSVPYWMGDRAQELCEQGKI